MTKLAYILAASHSGSTLLTMLLNSHPDVATVGELAPGHMEDGEGYRCSCGTRIRECSFWQWVIFEMRKKGIDFRLEEFGTRFSMPDSRLAGWLLGPLHHGPVLEFFRDVGLGWTPGWPERIQKIMRTNEALIELIMKYYHARVFVDKGNIALRLKYLLRIPSFDIKVIHLIRDGRAVALTYMDPASYADALDPKLRGGGGGGGREDERLLMARAAYEWSRSNEEAQNVLRGLDKSRRIEVRYEDLCTHPQTTLDRLLTFLGLDPAKRVQDFRTVEHHVVGNGMRLDTTSRIQLDDRWRSTVTRNDSRTFDLVAGKMNQDYGYE
ncbi:MAG: hypothetical protein A2Z25_06080 [Planctomycetes bacterium RBG_16_55_9]|nr:MAG: hypothetical protein A2Z25_06080 [Planctomycetes bacterium RBG_16_55_9]